MKIDKITEEYDFETVKLFDLYKNKLSKKSKKYLNLIDILKALKSFNFDINLYLRAKIKDFDNHYNNIYNLEKGINSPFCLKMKSVVTADSIIFSNYQNSIYFAVINRLNYPDCNKYAFAGGIVEKGESPEKSSIREALEETGLNEYNYIENLGEVESFLWDSRFTEKSKVYGYSVNVNFDIMKKLTAGDDAKSLKIVNLEELLTSEMAFCHKYWLLQFLKINNIDYDFNVIEKELEKTKFFILCDKVLSNEVRKSINCDNLHPIIKLLFELNE